MEMMRYSIEPRTRKYVEEYGFLSFARKYEKQLLDTRLNSLKTASKKVVQNAGEFIGNKIADAVTKSKDGNTEKQEPVKEIIIPPEKRDKIFNTLRKVLQKGNTTKYLNYGTIQLYQNLWQKMDWSKWLAKLSVFCQQKYNV